MPKPKISTSALVEITEALYNKTRYSGSSIASELGVPRHRLYLQFCQHGLPVDVADKVANVLQARGADLLRLAADLREKSLAERVSPTVRRRVRRWRRKPLPVVVEAPPPSPEPPPPVERRLELPAAGVPFGVRVR